jgi:hypothetical protein
VVEDGRRGYKYSEMVEQMGPNEIILI